MVLQYIILVAYFGLLFGIGALASRRIRNMSDYYVGGKKLGYWVVAFSARATGESAWLLLGLTGLGAMVGVSAFWVVLGEVLGVAGAWWFMAKPFKRETDHFGSITVPDYLVSKFTDGTSATKRQANLLRILAAGTLVVFITIYVSAQIDATGKAFESFLSWNYYAGVLVGFGIVVLYTFGGGFVAVAWSDVLQGSLMLLGLVLVPVMGMLAIPAGANLWAELKAIDPGLVNPWGSGGWNGLNAVTLISYLAIGVGFLGSPQVFVRFMSIKQEADIDRGRWVAVTFTLLTDAGAVMTGILGRYLLVGPDQPVETILGGAAEGVLPAIVTYLFPAIIVGLFIAAVLAAIMSTIDSLLVVASSAVTRDFYQQLYQRNQPEDSLKRMSRVVTLSIAVFALAIALLVSVISPTRTVFWFAIFGWSGIAATFCPAIILSLSWKGFNLNGVIASMLVGFLGIPFFKFAAPTFPAVGPYFALLGEMFPAVVCALIAGVIASNIMKHSNSTS